MMLFKSLWGAGGLRYASIWSRGNKLTYPNGLFGIPGLVAPKDFSRIATERVEAARVTMQNWRDNPSPPSPEADIEVLDSVSNSLCRIADAAEFIRNVESRQDWIEAATQAVESVAGFMNEANVDTRLFERARSLRDKAVADPAKVSWEHRHVICAMVTAMENEGVHLPVEQKTRLVGLQEQDTMKSFSIIQTSDDGSGQDVGGVWVDASSIDPGASGIWRKVLPSRVNAGKSECLVTSVYASHLLRIIHDRSTRQRIWENTMNGKSDAVKRKEEAMHELVEIRRELAKIRGYTSWNEYAQRESVLSSRGGPAAVEKFLADLYLDLVPGIARELDALTAINENGASVEPWDLDYLMQKWKALNSQSVASITEIQKHLTFPRILAGGQSVLRNVLGVDLQFDKGAGKLWHPDAFRLELTRLTDPEKPIGYLYLDPYERGSKSVQSAQFTLAGSKVLSEGTRQIPQTALVLSLPNNPSMALPLNVAVTFFHELGHACHSLLSETKLQHFSGSRGAIDFVEFPSHLFEYFASEPECLDALINGEKKILDASYLEHYAINRNPFSHIEMAQQLTYAMVDQVYYATGSPENVAGHLPTSNLVNNERLLSMLQPASVANFEHLVHYGGSYYCYLLCRALAAHVWDKSFRGNPWNSESGARLASFLHGGSVDQSLNAIYSILDVQDRDQAIAATAVPREALIRDINRCATIHGQ